MPQDVRIAVDDVLAQSGPGVVDQQGDVGGCSGRLPPCAADGLDVWTTLARLRKERGLIDARIRELAATRDSLDDLIAVAENRGERHSTTGAGVS